MSVEHRSARASVRAHGRKLIGTAAVFGSPAQIGAGGSFTETIQGNAFAGSLASGSDILALVDHDPARLLGRTASGTLRLHEDPRGLHFELDLPETETARDLLALVERGDVGGASIGFTGPPGGDQWAGDVRTITSAHLHEISIVVAWPAYAGTEVQARSAAHAARQKPALLAARRWLETTGEAGR